MSLPRNYRIKAEDLNHAWDIFNRYLEASDEELALMDTVFDAEEIFHKTGTWPTFGEADDYGWKKADAYAEALWEECTAMRNHSRRAERRPPQRIGPMETERTISDVPSFVALLHRFTFIDKERKLKGHAGWSEYTKVENDLVVTRIREQLLREGKMVKRGGLFDNVRQTEQALASMSEDQLLRCRARYFLGDFRLSAEDKGEEEK